MCADCCLVALVANYRFRDNIMRFFDLWMMFVNVFFNVFIVIWYWQIRAERVDNASSPSCVCCCTQGQIIIIIIIIIIMKDFNRRSSMVTMAQSAANWRNTHTHMDRTHSFTHLHQHSCNHVVWNASSAILFFELWHGLQEFYRAYVIILVRAFTHGGWAHRQRVSTTYLTQKNFHTFVLCKKGSPLSLSLSLLVSVVVVVVVAVVVVEVVAVVVVVCSLSSSSSSSSLLVIV